VAACDGLNLLLLLLLLEVHDLLHPLVALPECLVLALCALLTQPFPLAVMALCCCWQLPSDPLLLLLLLARHPQQQLPLHRLLSLLSRLLL
jgi:hypothetical protein